MSLAGTQITRLLLLVLAACAGVVSAQETQTTVHAAPSSVDLAKLSPIPAVARSRITFFRTLLDTNAAARQAMLESYPPQKRAGLEAKIKEYELLSLEQRELRLRATELQEYLLPLMSAPATNRADQIAAVPPDLAPMIAERLEHWDKLSPEEQKNVLDNKTAVQRLIEFGSISPLQQNQVLTNMSPGQRQALQDSLVNWQRLSEDEREVITRHFNEFFSLTASERAKTLRTLSDAERAQIERTIVTFHRLEPRSRARILQKFCQLSPTEFKDFFKNVERWERLTPTERKAWRDLVTSASIQPPLPTGAVRPPDTPPLPSDPRTTPVPGAARPTTRLGTN